MKAKRTGGEMESKVCSIDDDEDDYLFFTGIVNSQTVAFSLSLSPALLHSI